MISRDDLARWEANAKAIHALVVPAQEQAERARALTKHIAKQVEPREQPFSDAPAYLPLLPPNFRGDNVKFTRRDEHGNIVSAGAMHRDHILAEQVDPEAATREGGRIQIEDDDHPGFPAPSAPDPLLLLQAAITEALTRSDRYMLADALENIAPGEQNAWREYRKVLRAAHAMGSAVKIIAALPKINPKGSDPFAFFRTQTGKLSK